MKTRKQNTEPVHCVSRRHILNCSEEYQARNKTSFVSGLCNGNRAQHQEKLCKCLDYMILPRRHAILITKHTSTQNGSNPTFTLSLNEQNTTKKCLTISIQQDLKSTQKLTTDVKHNRNKQHFTCFLYITFFLFNWNRQHRS